MRYLSKLRELAGKIINSDIRPSDQEVSAAENSEPIDFRRKDTSDLAKRRATVSRDVPGDRESKGDRVTKEDYERAVAECNRAMKEWKIAQHKLDWVVEPDQIDYAVYSVIAAEKQYATLLKEAKRIHQQLSLVEAM